MYHGHLQKKNDLTINIYFHIFCNKKKVFTGNNSISMATPEGLTNAWNSHSHPIKLRTFNSLINRASQNGRKFV